MPAKSMPDANTLRQALRDATAADHERLDQAVTALDFARAADYRRFLSLQLMAREPIERWLGQSTAFAAPPRQAELIASDLDALGGPLWAEAARFDPPAAPGAIVGVCWAIAGSSLGNRAMHRVLTRIPSEEPQPDSFLADDSMTQYWQWLKPRIEALARQDEVDAAIAGARAVFATFLSAADDCLGPITADVQR